MKKAILIVLDSLGIGELPDAGLYGDAGADTLGHIYDSYPEFSIPNLRAMGFGNIEGAANGKLKVENPTAAYGRMIESSRGKDTTTGHWEMAGIITDVPFKTYPDGFPKPLMDEFEAKIGRGTLGNYPASGTEIIEVLGPEHEATGKPIVYTSADSVMQIAANTAVIPLEELYEICKTARGLLHGEYACGRVIARPYIIENGKRVRTSDRRDYSVSPPEKTLLDEMQAKGLMVYGVGKIEDIFNGCGITEAVHIKDNMDGVDQTIKAMGMDFTGFIFTNLVDFDAKYGHRRDPVGYGKCIEEFDARIPELLAALGEDDILMITADHGNDPIAHGTDHTREYVPVLLYGKNVEPKNMGDIKCFDFVCRTALEHLTE